MGKRGRARGKVEKLSAAGERVHLAAGRRARAARRADAQDPRASTPTCCTATSLSQEDAWQRAIEFLFERLAVRWVVSDVPTEGQRELLLRLRVATPDERRWIRDVLREHLAEHFPDLEAP